MNKVLAILMAILFVCLACEPLPEEPEYDNPEDKEKNPDYIAPETDIVSGPGEGEELTSHTVTFEFSGNENVQEYSYRLDDEDWSAWQEVSTVTFEYLDEDDHSFQVMGRYNQDDEDETPAIRNFTVNAIQGPALRFFPRKINTTSGSTFSVEIYAEEVVDMMGVSLEISTSDIPVDIISYQILDQDGDFLLQNGGNVITLDEQDGTVSLVLNIAVSNSDPAGLSGSGAIVRMEMELTSSENAEVNFNELSEMQNSEIQDIEINELVPLKIFVE